jgi:hypothetical protein
MIMHGRIDLDRQELVGAHSDWELGGSIRGGFVMGPYCNACFFIAWRRAAFSSAAHADLLREGAQLVLG